MYLHLARHDCNCFRAVLLSNLGVEGVEKVPAFTSPEDSSLFAFSLILKRCIPFAEMNVWIKVVNLFAYGSRTCSKFPLFSQDPLCLSLRDLMYLKVALPPEYLLQSSSSTYYSCWRRTIWVWNVPQQQFQNSRWTPNLCNNFINWTKHSLTYVR